MMRKDELDPSAVARQMLVTNLLCGVDFVPVASAKGGSKDGSLTAVVGASEAVELAEPCDDRHAEARAREVELKPAAVKAAVERTPTRETVAKRVPDPKVVREKQLMLDTLRERHDRECLHCTTAVGHMRLVFGEGNPDADLMFIGEAPGLEEDKTGRPFVGRAGQKLDEIVRAMGFERNEVYIANVLKARPPENRTPTPLEAERCSPWLAGQVRIIRPRVIVGLGKPACQFLFRRTVAITRERGQWQEYVDDPSKMGMEGHSGMTAASGEVFRVPVMPTYHPAYILRNYTMETRMAVWEDMQAVMRFLSKRS